MKTINYLIGLVALSMAMFSCSNDYLEHPNNEKTESEQQKKNSVVVTLKSGIVVKQQGEKYYFQEDILLSEQQLEALEERGDFMPKESVADDETGIAVNTASGYNFVPVEVISKGNQTRSLAIYPTPYNMWAMVRFTYAHSSTGTTLNPYTKSLIQQALRYWERHTNVRFYNATNEPTRDPNYGFDYPFVNFCDGSENASYVGRIGGKQDLTLVPYGCSVGTVIHEIGHAIGLLHEQCRHDRDNYIDVNMSNIEPDSRSNFQKRTTNYYTVGSLDFNSVMMYSSYTGFEINPSIPAMRKKDGSTWVTQRDGLSENDKFFPNRFYLPYIARSDVYRELAEVVYKPDNTIMTEEERLELQAQLNYGNPTPPANGRIPNDF